MLLRGETHEYLGYFDTPQAGAVSTCASRRGQRSRHLYCAPDHRHLPAGQDAPGRPEGFARIGFEVPEDRQSRPDYIHGTTLAKIGTVAHAQKSVERLIGCPLP